jgi:transcriptional regulator with AAA-type ATPase domain
VSTESSASGQPGNGDQRVVRARSHVAGALVVAEGGRPAEAERKLRDALGVLERRHLYAGAARAAATLGYLLRERGDVSRAESTFERARVLFDVATPVATPFRSPLLEVDEGRAEREDYVQAKALLTTTRATAVDNARSSARPEGADRPRSRDQSAAIVSAAGLLTRTLAAGGDRLSELCSCLQGLVHAEAVALRPIGPGARWLATAGTVSRRMTERLLSSTPPVGELATAHDGRHSGMAMTVSAGRKALARLLVLREREVTCDERVSIGGLVRLAAVLCVPEVEWVLQWQSPTGDEPPGGLLGRSAEMYGLRAAIRDAAGSPFPVLIGGETGTGKELVARALHRLSRRSGGPFCAVNCAALTDELFEAELFGYARGAFTGAVTQRPGLFEEAHRGTLFLDEVGELSPRAQAKLLRAVQEGEVRRLGENSTRRVDVRLIAATNRELAAEVAAGNFRQDLLFRLAVIQIQVPPLRERRDDIGLLACHFWRQVQTHIPGRAVLGSGVLETLGAYDWPGNVRELENVVAALSVRAPERGHVSVEALPKELKGGSPSSTESMTLAQAREAAERECVRAAMARATGRPGVAARELGISRQGLAKLMKRLGLTRHG